MPAKRRLAKARTTPMAEAKAWSDVFWGNCDYISSLEAHGGVEVIGHQVSREDAEEAWHRLGAIYLEHFLDRDERVPWALKEFGEPTNA